jgi:tetratricopeptide (TPR) repeat protein
MSFTTRIRTFFSPEASKRAQGAEARGELEEAVACWMQAGRYADAVRVMLLRASAELDAHRRSLLLAQATTLAPRGDPARLTAWRARAQFIMDRAEAGALEPSVRRRDLLEAGRALREQGDGELAARALRMAGDLDGEISALADAGALAALEAAVSRQRRAEETRARHAVRFEEARDLLSIGRRREADTKLRAALAEDPADDLEALLQGLAARRPRLPAFVQIGGRVLELVPGNPVVLGRSEGELKVPAPVVSRRHLEIRRRDGQDPWVRDLGGKNGTTLRGARVDQLAVGGGIDLLIGGALPLKVRPFERGGLLLELPGRVAWLPLGPVELGPLRVSFEHEGGWLELRTTRNQSLILGDLLVESPVQLLVGDEIFESHGGNLLLRVVPPNTSAG